MKVRILSGNQTGAVVEMRQDEAEAAIATGYGEAVVEEPATQEPAPVAELQPEPEPKKKKG